MSFGLYLAVGVTVVIIYHCFPLVRRLNNIIFYGNEEESKRIKREKDRRREIEREIENLNIPAVLDEAEKSGVFHLKNLEEINGSLSKHSAETEQQQRDHDAQINEIKKMRALNKESEDSSEEGDEILKKHNNRKRK